MIPATATEAKIHLGRDVVRSRAMPFRLGQELESENLISFDAYPVDVTLP